MKQRILKCSKVVVALLILFFSGCASIGDLRTSSTEYPVMLNISRENGGVVDPVNIAVTVDSKKVIDQDFYNARGLALLKGKAIDSTGIERNGLKLNLSKGTHQIIVESKNGDAGLDIVFEVNKPLWLSLTYWGRNHFQLIISEHTIVFM